MLQSILAAREDENEFAQIPHNYNRHISKGFYDREIVANITHFFLDGKFNCQQIVNYYLLCVI